MTERRSRRWWERTVERWRRSGLSAAAFADREGLKVGTLRWWSSALLHGTRAKHGSTATAVPIEIAVPAAESLGVDVVEIAIGAVAVRCTPGTDVGYVAALVRAIAG